MMIVAAAANLFCTPHHGCDRRVVRLLAHLHTTSPAHLSRSAKLNSVDDPLDVVWMGKGWLDLIPKFEEAIHHHGVQSAKIRIAERNKNGYLNIDSLRGADGPPPPPSPSPSSYILFYIFYKACRHLIFSSVNFFFALNSSYSHNGAM
jgi:hypothetical protein